MAAGLLSILAELSWLAKQLQTYNIWRTSLLACFQINVLSSQCDIIYGQVQWDERILGDYLCPYLLTSLLQQPFPWLLLCSQWVCLCGLHWRGLARRVILLLHGLWTRLALVLNLPPTMCSPHFWECSAADRWDADLQISLCFVHGAVKQSSREMAKFFMQGLRNLGRSTWILEGLHSTKSDDSLQEAQPSLPLL